MLGDIFDHSKLYNEFEARRDVRAKGSRTMRKLAENTGVSGLLVSTWMASAGLSAARAEPSALRPELKLYWMDLNQYGEGNSADAAGEIRLLTDLASVNAPIGKGKVIFSGGVGVRSGHDHDTHSERSFVSQDGISVKKGDRLATHISPTGVVFGRAEWHGLLEFEGVKLSPYVEVGSKVDIGLGRGLEVENDRGDTVVETRMEDLLYQDLGLCLETEAMKGCAGYYEGGSITVYDPSRLHPNVRENGVSASLSVKGKAVSKLLDSVFSPF